MIEFPILSLITFLPIIGVIFIATIDSKSEYAASNAKYVALFVSLVTFLVSLYMYFNFNPNTAEFQFVEEKQWLPGLGISYKMGVDGISVLFVMLATFLTPICILASWDSIKKRVKEYMMAFLILETMMVGMFCSMDMLLFYVFFEAILIPMYLIIGIWGGDNRVYAAFKFFLYTLLGSVLLLIAMLYLYMEMGTTDIQTLMTSEIPLDIQKWLWLAMFASFAVKVPMWPVHTWLPDAHVQAPTAGSVILAGVLLKMGGYGFLRFSIPILPEATAYFADFVFVLSVIAVVYTSMVALVQTDMKKLIAYSSIAHMGFVTLGIFTLNTQGVEGAIFQMLSHGIVSAALFLCVGVVYDRLHTREIDRYGGLVKNMPKYAVAFMIFTMASVGLPVTSGFVGEFLILIGLFQVSTIFTFIAATGVVLGAAYMLLLYKRVVFGEQKNEDVKTMKDLNKREIAIFAPLILLVFWMGIYPSTFLKPIAPSVENLIANYNYSIQPTEMSEEDLIDDELEAEIKEEDTKEID